jgi:hypothetical protein
MSRWWFRGIGMALLATGLLWLAYAKYDPSRYSGGDGLTRDTAIVVETASDLRGIALEYVWLREHYPGARRLRKPLTRQIKGRRYHIVKIQTPTGETLDLWFDITSFYPASFYPNRP